MDILDSVTGLDTTVALMGASWSVGEWYIFSDHNHSLVKPISHRSPEIFLHHHFSDIKIYHLGISGGTNQTQVDTFADMPCPIDLGVIYWTCPGRDVINLWDYDIKNNCQETMELVQKIDVNTFKSICESHTTTVLEKFNSLNIPICFIGGHVSLPNMDKYENCYPVVDRMSNLVEEPFWDWGNNSPVKGECHNKIDWLGLERISHISDTFALTDNQIESFKEQFIKDGGHFGPWHSYYFPDQGHGGRYLHRLASMKLAEFIRANDFI